IGDPTKAKEKLGWTATVDLTGLVTEMVEADLRIVAEEARHRSISDEISKTGGAR
ncbi:MAG: hypothetical protein RIS52_650, partial [Pseudomonadota bacterium]